MFFLSLILGTPRAHSHTHGERGLSARARHDTARVTGRLTARRPADHLHQSKRLEGGTWWREAMNGEVAAAPKAPPPFFKKPLPWDYGILRAAVRQGTFFFTVHRPRRLDARATCRCTAHFSPTGEREEEREKSSVLYDLRQNVDLPFHQLKKNQHVTSIDPVRKQQMCQFFSHTWIITPPHRCLSLFTPIPPRIPFLFFFLGLII